MLRPYELDRQTFRRVAAVGTVAVLGQPALKPKASRSNVVAAIGTAQHIDVNTGLFQKAFRVAALRDGRCAASSG
jgi:hypothetical protein